MDADKGCIDSKRMTGDRTTLIFTHRRDIRPNISGRTRVLLTVHCWWYQRENAIIEQMPVMTLNPAWKYQNYSICRGDVIYLKLAWWWHFC